MGRLNVSSGGLEVLTNKANFTVDNADGMSVGDIGIATAVGGDVTKANGFILSQTIATGTIGLLHSIKYCDDLEDDDYWYYLYLSQATGNSYLTLYKCSKSDYSVTGIYSTTLETSTSVAVIGFDYFNGIAVVALSYLGNASDYVKTYSITKTAGTQVAYKTFTHSYNQIHAGCVVISKFVNSAGRFTAMFGMISDTYSYMAILLINADGTIYNSAMDSSSYDSKTISGSTHWSKGTAFPQTDTTNGLVAMSIKYGSSENYMLVAVIPYSVTSVAVTCSSYGNKNGQNLGQAVAYDRYISVLMYNSTELTLKTYDHLIAQQWTTTLTVPEVPDSYAVVGDGYINDDGTLTVIMKSSDSNYSQVFIFEIDTDFSTYATLLDYHYSETSADYGSYPVASHSPKDAPILTIDANSHLTKYVRRPIEKGNVIALEDGADNASIECYYWGL